MIEKNTTLFNSSVNQQNRLNLAKDDTLYFIKSDNDADWDINSQIELTIIPQSVAYSYSPNFANLDMLGRLSPVYMYTGGSDKQYTFSVTIHEDMEDVRKHGSIIDFVNKVKALSYPVNNSQDLPYLKNVYFQLGIIQGRGIVNTSVSWKKPFRNGRYIVADISFTVTVIESLPLITKGIISTKQEGTNATIDKVIYSGLTTERYTYESAYLRSAGYNTNISNLVSVGETEVSRNAMLQDATRMFEYNLDRLNVIYNAFAKVEQSDTLINLIQPAKNFYNTYGKNFVLNNSIDLTDAKSKKELSEQVVVLANIKKNIKAYLSHYYKNTNKDITPEQLASIEEQLLKTIEQLDESLARIVKYGAGN